MRVLSFLILFVVANFQGLNAKYKDTQVIFSKSPTTLPIFPAWTQWDEIYKTVPTIPIERSSRDLNSFTTSSSSVSGGASNAPGKGSSGGSVSTPWGSSSGGAVNVENGNQSIVSSGGTVSTPWGTTSGGSVNNAASSGAFSGGSASTPWGTTNGGSGNGKISDAPAEQINGVVSTTWGTASRGIVSTAWGTGNRGSVSTPWGTTSAGGGGGGAGGSPYMNKGNAQGSSYPVPTNTGISTERTLVKITVGDGNEVKWPSNRPPPPPAFNQFSSVSNFRSLGTKELQYR